MGIKQHLYRSHGSTSHSTESVTGEEEDRHDNTVCLPSTSTGSESAESQVQVNSPKDSVLTDFARDLASFYSYAVDVLCISESSGLELTTRVEGIVKNVTSNIADVLSKEEEQSDTSFFHPIPQIPINKEHFDRFLHQKHDFRDSEEILCSNGDTFSYVAMSHYVRTQFQAEKQFETNDVYLNSNFFLTHINPMNDVDTNVVHILLYSDEFEVCNPIGVARSKHKLLSVYFKVLNFHPRHTSNLNALHLVMLVKYTTVKSVGLDEIFAPLIQELNEFILMVFL